MNKLQKLREPKVENPPSIEERLQEIEARLELIEFLIATQPDQGLLGKITRRFKA